MIHSQRLYLLLLIVCVVLASCTLEKRLYNPGYYVEWNVQKKENRSHPKAKEALTEIPSIPLRPLERAQIKGYAPSPPPALASHHLEGKALFASEKILEHYRSNIPDLNFNDEDEEPTPYSNAAIISFLCSIVPIAIFLIIVAIGSLFGVVITLGPVMVLIFLICALFGLIFGIRGFNEIVKSNKRGMGFALAGIIIPILYIMWLFLGMLILIWIISSAI